MGVDRRETGVECGDGFSFSVYLCVHDEEP